MKATDYLRALPSRLEARGTTARKLARALKCSIADIEALSDFDHPRARFRVFLDVLRELGDRLEGIEDVTPEGVLAHIERCRVSSGISQDELADTAEVSRPHYSDMLRRPTLNPKLRTMLRLAAAAECELNIRLCDPAPAHPAVALGAQSPGESPSCSPPSPPLTAGPRPTCAPSPSPSAGPRPTWAPLQPPQDTTPPPLDAARHAVNPASDEPGGSFLHFRPRYSADRWDADDDLDDWMSATSTTAKPSPVSPVLDALFPPAVPTKSPPCAAPTPLEAATAPARSSPTAHEAPRAVQPQVHTVRTIKVPDRRLALDVVLIPGARELAYHEILEVRVPGVCMSIHTGTIRLRMVAGQHTLYYEDHTGPRLSLDLSVEAVPECSFKYVPQPPVW